MMKFMNRNNIINNYLNSPFRGQGGINSPFKGLEGSKEGVV